MKRRLKWALVLSLVLHAVLLVVWRRAGPVKPAVRGPEPSTAVELEIVQAPPVVSEEPAIAPSPVVKAPARAKRSPAPAPVVTAPAPLAPPTVAEGAPDPQPSSPRSAFLVPRESAVKLPVPEEQESKGKTTHNRPEELPDPAAVLAYEAEVVQKRVDGWVHRTLAKSRVDNGVISYYFHDLRHRLEKVTEEPPPFIEPFGLKSLPEHGKQAVSAWETAAARYGKTGSAYDEPAGYKELHGVAKSEAEKGGKQAREFAQKMEMGARLRDFGDGKMGEELIAIVQLKQGSNGALADLSLLQPSSSIRFDAWVMAQAPKALDGLVDPPDSGVGIHAEGMRSVWAFKGRVTYKRKLEDAKLLEDGWYVGLMAIPGLLTGNFDEVTGTVEYVDLRYPRYECKVQLLEVY